MESPDQLHEMFHMQKALNERTGVHAAGMSEADQTQWISLKSTLKHELERKVG